MIIVITWNAGHREDYTIFMIIIWKYSSVYNMIISISLSYHDVINQIISVIAVSGNCNYTTVSVNLAEDKEIKQ